MKKILKTLAFTTLVLISVNSNAQIIANLMARWNFNTNPPTDVGPNAIPLVSSNNLTLAPGFRGYANGAVNFNGTSSTLTFAHSPALYPNSGAITIISLIRFNGFYSGLCQGNCIVSKGFPNFSSGNYQLHTTDNFFDNSCLISSPNNNQVGACYGTSAAPAWTPTSYLNFSNWYFLASSYDGTTVRYYQYIMDPNNVNTLWTSVGMPPSASAAATGSIGFNTQALTIGWNANPPYPYWFDGDIDDLLIYNGALSDHSMGQVYRWLWGKFPGQKTDEEIGSLEAISNNNSEITIHPNPSSGFFNFTFNNQNFEKYIINDLYGKIILSSNINENESTNLKIDLSNQAKGIYFIEFLSKDSKKIIKLILQ